MSEDNLVKWGHSLNVQLSCLAGILLLLVGTVIGFTLWFTAAHKADGLVINLAGRQRMLVQLFSKEFLQEARLRQSTSAAERFAADISQRATQGREYYTANVINKLQSKWSAVAVDVPYHEIEKILPLPATYVREVFESSGNDAGYRYELLSKWNINAAHGIRDEFEQRAWNSLLHNPQMPYQEYASTDQGVELRYATADVGSDESCVACHNNHPASPKKDFKLNDLMGIQVVSVAVTQDSKLAEILLNEGDVSQHKDSARVRKLFEMTLAALSSGGTTYNDVAMTKPVAVPVPTIPRIQTELTAVEDLWKQLQQAASGMDNEAVDSAPTRNTSAGLTS